jgi:hypothetical protein
MGLKTIKGRPYFYDTRRVNGRHETVYVGGGEVAGMAVAVAQARRREREADQANRRFLASVKALAALRRTGPETLVQVINKGSVRVG